MTLFNVTEEARHYDQRVSKRQDPSSVNIREIFERRTKKGVYCWFYEKRLYETLRNIPKCKILDMACGTGFLSVLLAKFGHNVVAIDISIGSIEYAKELALVNGVANKIEFKVMDASKLEFDDNTFDYITGEDALHHIIKYTGAIDHIYRVLKPGGIVILHEPFAFNPLINLLRFINVRIKHYEGEQFLGRKELKLMKKAFDEVTITDRSVLYPFARFFINDTPLNRRINLIARKIDTIFQRTVPFASRIYALGFVEMKKN
ncbi:MAG: class I SAM-dependent methyltransferase [Bacteroidales bacterium]